jgi:hypothetical protein
MHIAISSENQVANLYQLACATNVQSFILNQHLLEIRQQTCEIAKQTRIMDSQLKVQNEAMINSARPRITITAN